MKLLPFLVVGLFATTQINAENISSNQNKVIQKVYLEESTSIPSFVKFEESEAPAIDELKTLFQEYFKNYPAIGFRLLRTETDNLGLIHYRYIQTYKGIDIEFAELMVHTKNGKITSWNGKLVDNSLNELQGLISEKSALEYAKKHIGAKIYKWEVSSEESFIKKESGDSNATFYPEGSLVFINPNRTYESTGFRKAYRFNIYAHQPISRSEIYVDATDGAILYRNEQIHTSNVQGSAVTAYSGVQTINTDSTSPGNYRLRQTVSGNGVNTYDLNLTNNYGSAVDFTDFDNNWNNINSQKDQYATDAHWGAEKTYDYFLNVHGRNSINNNGFALNSYIHSTDPQSGSATYVNAYWDGQRMTYGDGNSNYNPLVALDIAGHEITHGLTTFTANLLYAAESGALNESFSDIFGVAIEFYARPNNSNWLMGEDIGSAFRSMSNPLSYGDPDTRLGPSWQNVIGCSPTNANDQCGVHGNSGVQNKWFYLLTVGGNGTNGIGNSYAVRGTGIDTASAVAFRNLTVYLGRNSDYDDARFFAIESAKDLYGDCSPQVASVTNAWYAVGVGTAYVSSTLSDFNSSETSSCQAPFQVSFNNNSSNGNTYYWTFGDGNSSTARIPSHTYQNFGSYDVKLVVDGGVCGVDSLERISYIDVDSTILCEILLLDGTNPIQDNCIGKIYDSGGASGTYSADETGIMTISPSGAANVTLNFISFDVEAGTGSSCNYDNLEIFDGPDVQSNLIGTFCNNNIPTSITSTNPSITLRFNSDPAVENNGFEINWSCNLPSSGPVADFDLDNTNSCIGEVEFIDLSTNVPISWFWDFGDGNISTSQNPIHVYENTGNYTVSLRTTNSFGPDSITKNSIVSINRPNPPTVFNDTFCLNQSVLLNATGSSTLQWYNQKVGGSIINTGSTYNVGALNSTRSYWVEDFVPAPVQSLGPVSNTIGSGTNFTSNQYLIFDVFQPMILQNVAVVSGGSGTRSIELRDANGVILQTRNVYISSGTRVVTLNMSIPAGLNYQLGLSQTSQVDLYRNDSGTNYPYSIPGMISIKSSSASTNPTGYYYFFYNWQVKGIDCNSSRKEITANIDTSCTITGINKDINENLGFSIYPNPAKDFVTIQVKNNNKIAKIQLLDVTGKVINSNLINKDLTKFDLTAISQGVYFIKVIQENLISTKPFVHIK